MGFFVDRIRRTLGDQKVFLQGWIENEDFTNEVRFLIEAVESQDQMIKRLEERNKELEEDSFTIIELKTAMEIKDKRLNKLEQLYNKDINYYMNESKDKSVKIEQLENEIKELERKNRAIMELYCDI